MFKELGIPGLKPEWLEVVSAIFKGDVFAILPTGFVKLFNTHVHIAIKLFLSGRHKSQVVDIRAPRPLFFPLPPKKKKSWAGDARLIIMLGHSLTQEKYPGKTTIPR